MCSIGTIYVLCLAILSLVGVFYPTADHIKFIFVIASYTYMSNSLLLVLSREPGIG